MTTWNHRVIRKDENGETWYELHECFYDSGDDIPHSWTEDAISPIGGDVSELRWTLERMLAALDKPILVVDGEKLILATDLLRSTNDIS